MLLGNKCCSALLYSEIRICIPYKSWHACIYLCNSPLSYAPLCYSYLTIPYFYLYPCLMIKGMCKSWLHTISGSQNLNYDITERNIIRACQKVLRLINVTQVQVEFIPCEQSPCHWIVIPALLLLFQNDSVLTFVSFQWSSHYHISLVNVQHSL